MTITSSPTRSRVHSGPRLEIKNDYSENVRRFSMVLEENLSKNSPMKNLKKSIKKLLKRDKSPKIEKKSQFLEKSDDDEKNNFSVTVIQNDSGHSLVFWEESYET